MGILLWIIFGGLVGWVASLVMGTDAKQGLIGNIVLGILGALLGGFVSSLLGIPGITGFNLYSGLIALGGAILAVWIGRYIKLV
jgi:uncharacterized membrane protein YeaQ/YmgE (transglycosylase-associated protein family)